jgi:hypothetical protein
MTQHAEYVRPGEAPLGLATTRQMLEELAARFEISTPDEMARRSVERLLERLPDEDLDYRTVSGFDA